MLHRQRGAFNLYAVGILSVLFAAAAMAALFSIRSERNLFAEGAGKAIKLAGDAPAAVLEKARLSVATKDSKLRKCIIDGKAVISNVDCRDKNPTSKDIEIRDTRGFEAPKKPVEKPAEATSDPMLEKVIEKQLR